MNPWSSSRRASGAESGKLANRLPGIGQEAVQSPDRCGNIGIQGRALHQADIDHRMMVGETGQGLGEKRLGNGGKKMGMDTGPDTLQRLNDGDCPGGMAKAVGTDKTGNFGHHKGS